MKIKECNKWDKNGKEFRKINSNFIVNLKNLLKRLIKMWKNIHILTRLFCKIRRKNIPDQAQLIILWMIKLLKYLEKKILSYLNWEIIQKIKKQTYQRKEEIFISVHLKNMEVKFLLLDIQIQILKLKNHLKKEKLLIKNIKNWWKKNKNLNQKKIKEKKPD